MTTLYTELSRRKSTCNVQTTKYYYNGFSTDLLKIITPEELKLEVTSKVLVKTSGGYVWSIETENKR